MPSDTTDATEHRQVRFEAPAGSTGILLVRHGESAAAVDGTSFALVDGHGDPPLHPDGGAQAEAVGSRLAAEPITAIYVTTLRRTSETAAPLAGLLGLIPTVEPGLREVHLGAWEGGLLRQRVRAGDPIAVRMVAEERWDVIPGAEPAELFATRVREALTAIASAHPDELVAVFTHGGVIGSLLAQATGSRPFAFTGADNGSISHLVVTGDRRWVLRRFNDTAHLGGGLSGTARPPT